MKNKHGQATIFVIVAITVVVLIILFFLLKVYIIPTATISPASEDPNQYLAECVSGHMDEASKLIINNNGYTSKEKYKESMEFEYLEIPYLCHTPHSYTRCIAQEPVIISHLNEEIYGYIESKIRECFDSLKDGMRSEGFELLSEGEMSFQVELMPDKIRVEIEKDLKFSKAEEQKDFRKFVVTSASPLHKMALVVQRIVKEESLWANSGYLKIMKANKWVDINKFTTGSDNEIYTVVDMKTESSWRFAARGAVLPTPK